MYPSNIVTEPSRNTIFPSPVNTDVRPKVELQLPLEGSAVGVAAFATGRVRLVGIDVAIAGGCGVGAAGTGVGVAAGVLVGGNGVAVDVG